MCSTSQIQKRLLELSFHSPGLIPLHYPGRVSEAFRHARIFTGKILSGKRNIKNRDKQCQKIEENSAIQSHD